MSPPDDRSINGQLGEIAGSLIGINTTMRDVKDNIGKLFDKADEHTQQLASMGATVKAMINTCAGQRKGMCDRMGVIEEKQDRGTKRFIGILISIILLLAGLVTVLLRGG